MILTSTLVAALALPLQEAPAAAVPLVEVAIENSELLHGREASGRLILFLKSCTSTAPGDPIEAPFFENPQPMYSIDAAGLRVGHPVQFTEAALGFPGALKDLRGCWQLQALLDRNETEPRHLAPGNLISKVTTIEIGSGAQPTTTLVLDHELAGSQLPKIAGVVWFERPSKLLSEHLGRPVVQRAGVVLPQGYNEPSHPRRQWPTIFVVPGFGGDHRNALQVARRVHAPDSTKVIPQAVWVVLDPDGPLGHHLFVDSECNGPRTRALVEEFIPALEDRFRLVARPDARLVTGHSSGGWSSLWLALTCPETFGACYSSAPDPVDFTAFEMSDLTKDANIFVDSEGQDRPSYRAPSREVDDVRMTSRQEILMERVLAPRGDSGGQWDSWAACFSPRSRIPRIPKPLYDSQSGLIDRAVADFWMRRDIASLVQREWPELAPVLAKSVHLLCGKRDSFYLERAVSKLRDMVAARASAEAAAGSGQFTGDGYIEVLPGLDHGSLVPVAMLRFDLEMRKWLKEHGLGE